MEVSATNIANANTTRTEDGGPYRRRNVVFTTTQASSLRKNALEVGGVTVAGIVPDQTDFPVSYQPGHPHADQDGFVRLPNIQLPNEMIDMITASRSYEANLKSITLFKEMVEQSLSLLNGGQ